MAAAAGAGAGEPKLLHARRDSPVVVVGKPLPSGAMPRHAYVFDGEGRFADAPWDVAAAPGEFTWRHIELPRQNPSGTAKPLHHAQALIELLSPPLTLQEILAFVATGPHCGVVDAAGGGGALILRVSSPGSVASGFALRLAARVTESSVVTVSVGGVPRLAFGATQASILTEIPLGVIATEEEDGGGGGGGGRAVEGGVVIEERLLESLLAMNHADGAHTDNPVPRTVSNLLVHVLGTHVDHVHDIVTRLEMELDSIELHLDKGGHFMRKLLLDGRRFPKMHLDLQRLLQVVSHGDQVFPRVKEKCANKSWFASEDIVALEDLIGRLRRLKENLGFITNRVTTLQASLDSWQSEQINKSLYYLSFLSIIFLPLSIVTGVFGMNVGGVPWTEQKNPANRDGFFNVITRRALTRSSSQSKRHLKLFKGHKEDIGHRVCQRKFQFQLEHGGSTPDCVYFRLPAG
uniref:Magnesium transporter n=1 Tax=Leersia perrieri TaxID=77586 RepID=A0A0D9X429_9ORYZ